MNAGKYNHQIQICNVEYVEDERGFQVPHALMPPILSPFAHVKTTKGMTLIKNNSDFEKAWTNFTIRYPKVTEITRDMVILFRGKVYEIQYLNNVDEADVELEIQAKEVTH